MTRKLVLLSLPILLGLFIAALAVTAPAMAGKVERGPDTPDHFNPPGTDAFGVVESFPDHLVGSWTIDGVVYTATEATHFKMYFGPFYTGACVHVSYDPNSFNAYVIETQFRFKCNDHALTYFYGLIDQVPDSYTSTITDSVGITGTWVISGEEFVSTPQTHYDTRNGPLAVGACAGVLYSDVNGVNQAWLIRNEKLYRCIGPVSYNLAYGYVVTFPDDLYGAWVISDTAGMSLTFMTTPSTQLFFRPDQVDVGTCVGVKYYDDQGVNYAVLVYTRDFRHGGCFFKDHQLPSKIYATVDSMPTGTVTGTWTLAGVDFTATEETRIEEEEGPFEVGGCAEGTYDPTDGAMLFKKLESEEAYDCQARDGSQRFKLFGVVDMLPTNGLTGTWQVSGVSFQTTPTTTIEMRHGDLAIGAYVKVYFTYDSNSGERTAQAIWTHVAPGFGRIHFHGRFGGWIRDRSGDKLILDGNTILADPDIDAPASLKNGDMVWVNAYQDPNGVFATQVTIDQPVYLPLVRR
jgi:hypothetical protein